MTTGRKLAIAGAVVAGATIYMAYVGASSSWQYYVTADECLARGAKLTGQPIRVGGRIAPGSLRIAADRQEATFTLAAADGGIPVNCAGPLPDKLAEAMDVVVEGRLEQPTRLRGEKVITKCASKYAAKTEVADRAGEAAGKEVR